MYFSDSYLIYKELEEYITEVKRFFIKPYYQELNEPQISSYLMKKYAKEIAAHERFQLAKNEKQRLIICNDLLDDEEIDILSMNEIVSYANTYYEIDIKPKKEKKLRNIIQKMKKDGSTKSDIASFLDMSTYQVDKYY